MMSNIIKCHGLLFSGKQSAFQHMTDTCEISDHSERDKWLINGAWKDIVNCIINAVRGHRWKNREDLQITFRLEGNLRFELVFEEKEKQPNRVRRWDPARETQEMEEGPFGW